MPTVPIPPNRVLLAVRPNAGVRAWYQKRLDDAIEQMQTSLVFWLTAQYRASGLAQDAWPTTGLKAALRKLTLRWQSVFDKLAGTLAEQMAERIRVNTDAALTSRLRNKGLPTVKFTMTEDMRTAYEAVIGQQVGLIKSIASEHLTDVQGLVYRAVAAGHDLGTLSKALQARYGVTQRRAALIARDQSNKATTTLTVARQRSVGITEGIWKHSHAGVTPRPSHLQADGKRFELAEGMYLDGKWVLPGQEINCLPADSQIEFATGCKKLWRRRYGGPLTELVTDSGEVLKATPNHPILTRRGWVPISRVDLGEDVVSVREQVSLGIKDNVDYRNACVAELFDLAALYVGKDTAATAGFEFHGDVTHKEVDVVNITGFLPDNFSAEFAQAICESFFPEAHMTLVKAGFSMGSAQTAPLNRLFSAPQGVISGFGACLALLKGHVTGADDIGRRLTAHLNACQHKAAADHVAAHAEINSQREFAFASFVSGHDLLIRQLFNLMSAASVVWWANPASAETLGDCASAQPDTSGGGFESGAIQYQAARVVDKRGIDYAGHVYNLETGTGWYTSAKQVYHNCRCTFNPVIPGLD